MPYQAPLPIYTGAIPGRLDPNQQSRVLHFPDSTLSFATFSPFTARADIDNAQQDDLDDLVIEDELLGGRRIVIETSISGDSIWRFVPRPHLLHGVQNEGIFPREVIYCGMRIILSQDQWDIHKLDPAFICTVHPDSHPPTIEVKLSDFRNRARPATHPRNATGLHTPPQNDDGGVHECTPSKRRTAHASSSSSDDQKPPKKKRPPVNVEEVAENGSVSSMSIDGLSPPRVQQYSYERQAFSKTLFTEPEEYSSEKCSSDPPTRKRKLSPKTGARAWSPESTETPKRHRAMESQTPEKETNPQVRAFAKAYEKRKEERLKQRKAERADSFARRHEQLLRRMAEMAEIARQSEQQQQKRKHTKPREKGSDYMSWTETPLWTPEDVLPSDANPFSQTNQNHIPQSFFNPYSTGYPPKPHPEFTSFPSYSPQPTPQDRFDDQSDPSCNDIKQERGDTPQPESSPTPRATPEPDTSRHARWQSEPARSEYEDHRRASLLESMQKIRELERDKPIWEAEARKRRAKEEQEAREEETRKQAQEYARAQAEYVKCQEQAKQRLQETEEIRIKKERDVEEFIADQALRKQNSYIRRRWSIHDALSRYIEVSEEFDVANFNGLSLAFDNIPWPVGVDPRLVTVQDITWVAIESFFSAVKVIMDADAFKTLVSKSLLRFHPDRWRSRGILAAVASEAERECLASAANIVSQALTPIWNTLKRSAS